MKINDFTLSGYQKTRGREGEGFIAILKHKGKDVTSYEDYATGGKPSIHFEKDGYGQKELLATLKKINKAVAIPNFDRADMESCAEIICQMLDEGRDFEQVLRKLRKSKIEQERFAALILTGSSWTMTPFSDGPMEIGRLHWHLLGLAATDQETAEKQARAIIREALKNGKYKLCIGCVVVDLDMEKSLSYSTEEYIAIYTNAKEFSKNKEAL